ncbi:hypothetical protein JCM13664_12550 [Methylothermus subterraneus]
MDRRGTLNWQPGSKPWSLALDSLTLEDCALALADRGLTLALSLDVLARSIEVRNLCNDGKTPAEFKAALALKQGGAITIDGQLGLDLGSASAKLTASRLNLSPPCPLCSAFPYPAPGLRGSLCRWPTRLCQACCRLYRVAERGRPAPRQGRKR